MAKLREIIKTIDPDMVVFLGSHSSYFEIAPARKLAEDGYLDNLSKEIFRLLLSRYTNAKKAVESGTANNGWQERNRKALSAMRKVINRYVPLAEREVVSQYPRKLKDGVIVIVTGDEIGNYWMPEDKTDGRRRILVRAGMYNMQLEGEIPEELR